MIYAPYDARLEKQTLCKGWNCARQDLNNPQKKGVIPE